MKWVIAVGFVIIVFIAGVIVGINCCLVPAEFGRPVEIVTAAILLATFLAVFYYASQAGKLRRESKDANRFSTVAKLMERLCDSKRHKLRGYLHTEFDGHFESSLREVLKDEYWGNRQPKVADIEKDFWGNKDALHKLNQALRSKKVTRKVTALDVVEETLMSFDVLAMPVEMGIEDASKTAEGFGPVFRDTGPHILPFVAVQMILRGQKEYEYYYLQLLKRHSILADLKKDGGDEMKKIVEYLEDNTRAPQPAFPSR